VRGVTKEQLIERMDGPGGFAYGGYCGDAVCEQAIKDRTKATIRVLPDPEFRSAEPPTTCVWCGRPAQSEAVWAKAY
jgi:prolyl-tRNA synthetase